MSTTPLAASVSPEPLPRYRSEMARVYPLGPGEAALVLRADAEPLRVSRAFANAACELTTFRTLDEHARAIAERAGDALGEKSARRILDKLVTSGQLASDQALLRPRRHGGVGARITSIATLAQDIEQDALEATITGAIEHCRAAQRTPTLFVLDDARERGVQRARRDALRVISVAAGVSIAYAGVAEKLAYAERLASESGVERAIVRFALGLDELAFGVAAGANRNATLLHHVGEAFLSIDGGIEPRLARHPQSAPQLSFGGGEHEELFFHADRGSLLASLEPARETLFDVHEVMLGQSLHDLSAQVFGRGNVDVDGMTPEMLRGLASSKGRVVATVTGTYGDSGLDSPAAIAFTENPETRARLLRSHLDYLTAMSSPEVLRVTRRPTIEPAAALTTASFAIDARQLLPPFFPVGRGEGDLYGRTLQRCFDDAFVGTLPRALYVRRSRSAYPSRLARAPHRFTDLVAACVADAPIAAGIGDARARLSIAGRQLTALARSPLNALRSYVHEARLAAASRLATRAEALLSAPGAPPFFAEEMRDRVRASNAALAKDFERPADDLAAGRPADDAWQLARRYLRAFGELLEAWPALYEAAQRMRVEGVRLGHTL